MRQSIGWGMLLVAAFLFADGIACAFMGIGLTAWLIWSLANPPVTPGAASTGMHMGIGLSMVVTGVLLSAISLGLRKGRWVR